MSGFDPSNPSTNVADTNAGRLSAGAVVLLFVHYCLTAAPGMGWFDSADWALVIESWGLGHPPGSPGYIVTAGLFSHLLPLPFDRSLVLFSALCGALTLFPLNRILKHLGQSSPWLRFGWLILGGLLPNVWLQCVRIELYSMSTLLFFMVVDRCVARRRLRQRDWLTAFIVGVLVSVNPLFGIMAGVVFAFTVLTQERSMSIGSLIRHAAEWGGAAALGLLPFLYCFVVAGSDDRFIWGEWQTLEAVLFYFTGQDYAVNWAGEPDRWSNLTGFLHYWWEEGTVAIIAVGVLLSLRLGKSSIPWLVTILASFVLSLWSQIVYSIQKCLIIMAIGPS